MAKLTREEWEGKIKLAIGYGNPGQVFSPSYESRTFDRILRNGGYERYIAGEFEGDHIWEFWDEDDKDWGVPLLGAEDEAMA